MVPCNDLVLSGTFPRTVIASLLFGSDSDESKADSLVPSERLDIKVMEMIMASLCRIRRLVMIDICNINLVLYAGLLNQRERYIGSPGITLTLYF